MPARYTPALLLVLLCTSCRLNTPCRELMGHWTTQEGQELVFRPDGNALWLTKFGSQYGTIRMKFKLNCAASPATLDLSDFKNGPHSGQMLFGIFDWSSDTSFRFRYEVGHRPPGFDVEQTQKFTVVPD